MGYRAPNTGYGSAPKAWCDECGDDIPLHRAANMPRKPPGYPMSRLTAEAKRRYYGGVIPRPAGTALCKSCEQLKRAIADDIAENGEKAVSIHLKDRV